MLKKVIPVFKNNNDDNDKKKKELGLHWNTPKDKAR
jgi:hypothetical protein